MYLAQPDNRTLALWDECESYLREFDQLCREAEIPWVLHLIPSDLQVDPSLRSTVLSRIELDAGDYDFDAPQQRLTRLAADLGVPCHDPLAVMRAAHDDGAALYGHDDIHWSVRGNHLAGQRLGEFLTVQIRGAGR